MIVQFQTYTRHHVEGYDPTQTRCIAVRADAITSIDAPYTTQEAGAKPDTDTVPHLFVGERDYALAESWEHAVEKWELALAGLDDFDEEDFDDDDVAMGVGVEALHAAVTARIAGLEEEGLSPRRDEWVDDECMAVAGALSEVAESLRVILAGEIRGE